MKEELGRSPDLADMISMRMWWLIRDHHYGDDDGIVDNMDMTQDEVDEDKLLKFLMEDDDDKVDNSEIDFDIY
jgi:hypothetical protein